jgi:LPS export ABC transporter protein LptC
MILRQLRIWIHFAGIVCLAASCHQSKNTLELDENAPTQSMKNATIQHTDSGRLQMTTWGAEILNYDNEDQIQEFPKGVKATIYAKDGTVSSIITADEATNFQKKKLMNLRKNVVIVDIRKGTTTYTEDFYWDQDSAILYSNVNVLQIGKDGMRQRGTGFRSDEEMNNFRIRQPRFEFELK